jgi:hypothetical protein
LLATAACAGDDDAERGRDATAPSTTAVQSTTTTVDRPEGPAADLSEELTGGNGVFLGSPAANGQKVEADVMRKWRVSVPMDRVAAFKKKYDDAGVLIDIVKFDGIYTMPDDEVNYCFTLARTLGARAISCAKPAAKAS